MDGPHTVGGDLRLELIERLDAAGQTNNGCEVFVAAGLEIDSHAGGVTASQEFRGWDDRGRAILPRSETGHTRAVGQRGAMFHARESGCPAEGEQAGNAGRTPVV